MPAHHEAQQSILHEISDGDTTLDTLENARADTERSLIGLLNFLSGYRHPLHRLTGRGAHSTILSLVLSAYLTLPALDADWMRSATPARVADLANIQTHREQDHPTLGSAVKIGIKDEEAFEVLELLAGVLNESGAVLERLDVESLGVWMRGVLGRAQGDGAAVVREVSFRLGFRSRRDSEHTEQPLTRHARAARRHVSGLSRRAPGRRPRRLPVQKGVLARVATRDPVRRRCRGAVQGALDRWLPRLCRQCPAQCVLP